MDLANGPLLPEPKFIQGSFSLFFPVQSNIAAMATAFNEVLHPYYQSAMAINAPQDAGFEFPRLLLTSQHGYSQIVISQTNLVLIAQYSPDWQRDANLGREYFHERVPLLLRALTSLPVQLLFTGWSSVVQFPVEEEEPLLRALSERHRGDFPVSVPHEIQLRLSDVVDHRFFRNLTVRNYRTWSIPPMSLGQVRLASKNQGEQGLELAIDFNDRFSYNEDADYVSSPEVALELLDRGFEEFMIMIERVKAGSWL